MPQQKLKQKLSQIVWDIAPIGSVGYVFNDFMTAKQAEGLSPRTITLYRKELSLFIRWLGDRASDNFFNLNANTFREFILYLAKTRKNVSQHIAYRILRTATYWYEIETDDQYRSPFHRMRAPKIGNEEKVSLDTVSFDLLLRGCEGSLELRDKAILSVAYDSGLRVAEIAALNVRDIDMITGSVKVHHGKGDKFRIVFIGRITLRRLRAYLKIRSRVREADPLFLTDDGLRLVYGSMRSLLCRIEKHAGIKTHGWHSLRRGFARQFLRNGGGLFQLQSLLGHTSLETTRRYVGFTESDLEDAHRTGSPIDRMR